MADIYSENKVTMTLGEFIAYREALIFKRNLGKFVLENRASYDSSKRDVYDIGHKVLELYGLDTDVEEEQEVNAAVEAGGADVQAD